MAIGIPEFATQLADLQAQFVAGDIDQAELATGLQALWEESENIPLLFQNMQEVIAIKATILSAFQAALQVKGTVASVSALPGTAADRDAWKIDNAADPKDKHLYVRIGGAWVDLGSFGGDAGRSGYQVAVANGFTGTETEYGNLPITKAAIAQTAANNADAKAALANDKAALAQAAADNADAKAAAAQIVVDASATLLAAKDTAVAAAGTASDKASQATDARDAALAAQSNGTEALQSVNYLLRTVAGQGIRIGDVAGNFVFDLTPDGIFAKLLAGSVTDQAFDAKLLEDILALRVLRTLIRFIPGSGLEIGDPNGAHTFRLAEDGSLVLPNASVSSSNLVNGAVGDAAVSATILEDLFSVRALRQILRMVPGGGFQIGSPDGSFVFRVNPDGTTTLPAGSVDGSSLGAGSIPAGKLGVASVDETNLSTLLLDDLFALRSLRKIIRFVAGGGFQVGDSSGAFTFQVAADGTPTMTIGAGMVGESTLSPALFEDVLALRALRKIIVFSPGDGVQIGSPGGDFVVKVGSDGKLSFTFQTGTVSRSTLASDVAGYVREKVAFSAPGLVYAKTISTKRQVVKVTGSGETTISDGSANDDYPQLVGETVRFTSDRDGGTIRAMRMGLDGKNLITERGSTKVYIVVGYGQSLSIGTSNSGRAAITTADSASGVLMFNRGVRIIGGTPAVTDVVQAASIDRLVPLAASMDGSAYGQTHVETLATKLFAASGLRCVGFCAGVGGISYSGLKKGTVPYANMIAAIQRAHDILAGLGFDTEVIVTWQHGEANNGSSRATYKGYLVELSNDLNTDIKAITGQANVHLFGGQSPSLSQSQVPLALWEAGKENALIHCVGPLYQYPLSDSQHPTSVGYYWLGEDYWRAIKAVVVDGLTWKPLQPVSATLSGADIDLLFEGATGNVVIDTTGVTAITNYGLEFFDASGSPPAISSVTTISGGVRISLASAPTGSGKVVRGAWTAPGATSSPQGGIPGARTNLADQDPLVSADSSGKALPKRAVIFEIAVS